VEAKGPYIATVKVLSGGKREREREKIRSKKSKFVVLQEGRSEEEFASWIQVRWGDAADKRGN
jgi:hypothetical protein